MRGYVAVNSDVLVIGSDRFEHHTVPVGHPERPERARVMLAFRTGGALVEADLLNHLQFRKRRYAVYILLPMLRH